MSGIITHQEGYLLTLHERFLEISDPQTPCTIFSGSRFHPKTLIYHVACLYGLSQHYGQTTCFSDHSLFDMYHLWVAG